MLLALRELSTHLPQAVLEPSITEHTVLRSISTTYMGQSSFKYFTS